MSHYYLGYVQSGNLHREFSCYGAFSTFPDLWLGRMATFLLAQRYRDALILPGLERRAGLNTGPTRAYGAMSLFAWCYGVTYLGLELFTGSGGRRTCYTASIVWIVLLGLARAHRGAASPQARGITVCISCDDQHRALRRVSRCRLGLSIIYWSGPRAALSKLATPLSALSCASTCSIEWRSSVYVRLVALISGRDHRDRLGAR